MFLLRIFILFLVDKLTPRNQQQRKAWERYKQGYDDTQLTN